MGRRRVRRSDERQKKHSLEINKEREAGKGMIEMVKDRGGEDSPGDGTRRTRGPEAHSATLSTFKF